MFTPTAGKYLSMSDVKGSDSQISVQLQALARQIRVQLHNLLCIKTRCAQKQIELMKRFKTAGLRVPRALCLWKKANMFLLLRATPGSSS